MGKEWYCGRAWSKADDLRSSVLQAHTGSNPVGTILHLFEAIFLSNCKYIMSVYDYFEDIVCINLDISTDRRKHAEYYFDKLNIPARFFTAKKHPLGGMYGCFDSHIQVLKDAYDRGLNNILVFEDDFLPTASYSEEKLQLLTEFMKQNDDWDIIHLGYGILKEDVKSGLTTVLNGRYVTEDIMLYSPFCTVALCYSKKTIKKIIETFDDYIGIVHYDMYLASYLDFKNYCAIPMLFDQNFYLKHNNQSTDGFEYLLRFLFPFFAFTNLNYRVTVLKYYCNKYSNLSRYIHLFLFSILIYKIKTSVLFSIQKKYICSK